jgi:hypothetical protein
MALAHFAAGFTGPGSKWDSSLLLSRTGPGRTSIFPTVALRTDYVYVYKLERGQPKLVARMQSVSRGYGGLVRAFVQEHLLMVDFADPERHVGDCCAEGYIRVHYRLQEGLFIEDGARERGDLASRDGLPRPRFSDNRTYHGEPVRPSSQRSSGHFGL